MSVLEIVILLPILAALAVLFGAPARAASVGATLVNLVIVLALSWQYAAKGSTGLAFTHAREILANPAMSFSVGADGVSLILALLTAIVMFAAVWQIQDRPAIFYVASLLIGGGALGAFLTTDVFFIYAFHELALIPTFLMIALHGHAEPLERKKVAWKATVYLGVGSLVLLAGLVWLVIEFSGGRDLTFDLEALRAQAKLTPLPVEKQGAIFFVLLLGFGTLVSLFPFHSWAAPAYATAPTPVAMLHAGVLKKFGLYGLLRPLDRLQPYRLEMGRPLPTAPSAFFGDPAQSSTWANVNTVFAMLDHKFANGVSLRNHTRFSAYGKFYQNVFPGAVNAAGTSVSLAAYSQATDRDAAMQHIAAALSQALRP